MNRKYKERKNTGQKLRSQLEDGSNMKRNGRQGKNFIEKRNEVERKSNSGSSGENSRKITEFISSYSHTQKREGASK